mgnify:CR=1 FL=1
MLEVWDKYTEESMYMVYGDISKFIWYNILGLGCMKTLDVGCNIGMELVSFPNYATVTGIDNNFKAISQAIDRFPAFRFLHLDVTDLDRIQDNSYDMVFDRGLLIHLDDVDKAMSEMLRVSKKYVMNLEYYGEDGKKINWRGGSPLFYRNMKDRWKSYNVDIISDIEIPYEIDNNRVHYTLVKKR